MKSCQCNWTRRFSAIADVTIGLKQNKLFSWICIGEHNSLGTYIDFRKYGREFACRFLVRQTLDHALHASPARIGFNETT